MTSPLNISASLKKKKKKKPQNLTSLPCAPLFHFASDRSLLVTGWPQSPAWCLGIPSGGWSNLPSRTTSLGLGTEIMGFPDIASTTGCAAKF